MKKTLSLIVCLILIISSIQPTYAEISSQELDDVDNNQVQEIRKSMVLNLDKVNLYSPIKFTNVYDDFYSYEMFELLFNYGNVSIMINEVNEENIFKEKLLTKKYSSSLVQLKPNTKYVYDISVMQDEVYAMTFYGEITTGENIGDPVYCELLKLRDNINARSDKELLATMSETEPNNTFATANTIYDNYDVNGTISTVYDIDMYKIKFTNSGKADFWLGNISSGNNLDLYVYNENQQLIASSKNPTNFPELISHEVVVGGKWYYIKVVAPNESVNVPASYKVNVKFYEVAVWPAVKKAINYCYECPLYGGPHRGTDISSNRGDSPGDNIYAILSGVVMETGFHAELGNYIIIRHDGQYPLYDNTYNYVSSRYCHLDKIPSLSGSVSKGALIGTMGRTGTSTGVHLHLEVMPHNVLEPDYDYKYRVTIDPGKNFYPEVKCSKCGSYPAVPYNNDLVISNDLSDAGISINNNYFISVGAFKYLSIEEVQNYGISSEDLKELIEIIQGEKEFLEYIDYICNLINVLES